MLIPLGEPGLKGKQPPGGFALLALGFRPFYLLASMLALIAVPVWLAVLSGALELPTAMPGVAWHAHEMLFGFAAAVITGFLFTAVRNWTGLPTPTGAPLAALALLWLAGRLAMLFGPATPLALVELSFLPLVAVALGRVLLKAGNKRNYFVVVLLAALFAANTLFHARTLGWAAGDPLQGVHFGLALVIVLTTAIGGRVIPMFTINGLREQDLYVVQSPRLDIAAIGLTAAALLGWAAQLPAAATALLALTAAGTQLARIGRWHPWATRKVPLLWILHLSHAWIPLGLILLALAQWGLLPRSAALHGLALGTMSGLILGMMTRTALGHTGRMLVAGRIETAAYIALHVAVLARVLPAIVAPGLYAAGLHVAALAWCIAFGLYLLRYAPMLWRPRVDGKPG